MEIMKVSFSVNFHYPVFFTRDVFSPENTILKEILSSSGIRPRILLAVDSGVISVFPDLPEKIACYAQKCQSSWELLAEPIVIPGGEVCKNNPKEVKVIYKLIEKHRLCRHSFMLAIGGGAVLDAVGFAVATAHRGLRLIRMPTTTLSQSDAGVGVKNSINAFGKKNFIGTFAPPYAVICDLSFLNSLPPRQKRAGIAEAIKVALIKDRQFFNFLYRERKKLAQLDTPSLEKTTVICAKLHINHIAYGGDPFEQGTSRPLDFGHWSAHALEEMTDGKINHGEAVAIGVALDSLYACHRGWISEIELEKILITLKQTGFDLFHETLANLNITSALEAFREHLGGELTLTMPAGIGKRQDIHTVDEALMRECIYELKERHNKGR